MKNGVVLEMYRSSVAVLTPNGEFLKVRKDGIICEIGEEIWFHESDIILPKTISFLNKLGKFTFPRYVTTGLATAIMMLMFLPSAVHSDFAKEAQINRMIESLLDVFGNDQNAESHIGKNIVAFGSKDNTSEKQSEENSANEKQPEKQIETTSTANEVLDTEKMYDNEQSNSDINVPLLGNEGYNSEDENEYVKNEEQGLLTYTDFSSMKTFVTFPKETFVGKTNNSLDVDQQSPNRPTVDRDILKPIELAFGNSESEDRFSNSRKIVHPNKDKEKTKDVINNNLSPEKPGDLVAVNDIPKKPAEDKETANPGNNNTKGNDQKNNEKDDDSTNDENPISTPSIKDEYVGADTWGDDDDSDKSENQTPPPSPPSDIQVPSVDPNEPDDTPTVTPPSNSDIDMNATCQKDGYYVEYETILTFEKNANGEVVEIPKRVPIKKYCEAPSVPQTTDKPAVSDEKMSDSPVVENDEKVDAPPSASYDSGKTDNQEKTDKVSSPEEELLPPSESYEYTPAEESLTFNG
ncbi:anti-sigma factor domain-containing protein [Bacillus mexicanus]|uniref:anti-sigma factor domain-containing protein n=1 Tax=Bacillus mexicanus TaxID=2834415 RepID=UPI003D2349D6